MARVKDQDIPVELAALYATTLGPTRAVSYPGEQHAGLADQVPSHYPESIEPPHVPTEKQLKQREYFETAFKCFNEAPQNERTAYWRLSKAGPIPYYNDYMRQNIPLAIEGFTCPFWAAPLARSFKSDSGQTWGYVTLSISDPEEHLLHLELELDPIKEGSYPAPWPIADAMYSLVHVWFDNETEDYKTQILETWNPTARMEDEDDFTIPEIPSGPINDNIVFFFRYGADEAGEAVIWDWSIDDPLVYMEMENFE